MPINTDRIDDCVLALLLLGRHDGQRVWKSFDSAAMERLHEKGADLGSRWARQIRRNDRRRVEKGRAAVSGVVRVAAVQDNR